MFTNVLTYDGIGNPTHSPAVKSPKIAMTKRRSQCRKAKKYKEDQFEKTLLKMDFENCKEGERQEFNNLSIRTELENTQCEDETVRVESTCDLDTYVDVATKEDSVFIYQEPAGTIIELAKTDKNLNKPQEGLIIELSSSNKDEHDHEVASFLNNVFLMSTWDERSLVLEDVVKTLFCHSTEVCAALETKQVACSSTSIEEEELEWLTERLLSDVISKEKVISEQKESILVLKEAIELLRSEVQMPHPSDLEQVTSLLEERTELINLIKSMISIDLVSMITLRFY